jgi:hypothetical protein
VNAWGVYKPKGEAPWDLHGVVHLHRRAGFAAAWDEIERDLKDGPRTGGHHTQLLSARTKWQMPPQCDLGGVTKSVSHLPVQYRRTSNTGGGNRTHTHVPAQRILSHQRLP